MIDEPRRRCLSPQLETVALPFERRLSGVPLLTVLRPLWVDCGSPPASDRLAWNLPFEVACQRADGRAYPDSAIKSHWPQAALRKSIGT